LNKEKLLQTALTIILKLPALKNEEDKS